MRVDFLFPGFRVLDGEMYFYSKDYGYETVLANSPSIPFVARQVKISFSKYYPLDYKEKEDVLDKAFDLYRSFRIEDFFHGGRFIGPGTGGHGCPAYIYRDPDTDDLHVVCDRQLDVELIEKDYWYDVYSTLWEEMDDMARLHYFEPSGRGVFLVPDLKDPRTLNGLVQRARELILSNIVEGLEDQGFTCEPRGDYHVCRKNEDGIILELELKR